MTTEAALRGWGFRIEDGMLLVSSRCPECGRFVRPGYVRYRELDSMIELVDWLCKKCGPVAPYYEWE